MKTALAMAQRAGKKRRAKAIQAKIANTRADWTHKTTTAIARRAKLIVIGDVSRPHSSKLLCQINLSMRPGQRSDTS